MRKNQTHADYEKTAPVWARARDVLAGEDAVKAAAERYLPRLDSQTDEDYAAYKIRASFFAATARTLEQYLELIFRRAPAITLPAPEPLHAFLADCDGWGTPFLGYAKEAVTEVLSVGRAGSLALPGTARPCLKLYRAEDILNWELEQKAGTALLTALVLREPDHITVYRLVDNACTQEVWRPADVGYTLADMRTLQREGAALTFIPFVFHGPRHSQPAIDKLPLAELIAANLDHYRLDADYKYGLHFAAMPTAFVSGFDKSASMCIGSRIAWTSENPGASAGFLEFTGAGLVHLERALEKIEGRMALLGAQLLTDSQPSATTHEPSTPSAPSTISHQPSTNLSGLASIVAALNQSLSRVLQLAHWHVQGGEPNQLAQQVTFTMNTDFCARPLSGDEITAVVAAWRAGAISRETMLERLKRGDLLPDHRTIAQERALIHGKPTN